MTSLVVHHATHTGRVRDHNEDFVDRRSLPAPHQNYEVWVVADGMGGHSAGEVASWMATEAFIKSLSYGRWTDPAEGLRTAFSEANAVVHRQGRDMGTTLVAALVDVAGKLAWVGNVGDSRAYLLEGEQVRQVTRDHSLVQRRVDRGEISLEEAQRSKKNVLTSAIGPDARVTADVFGPFGLGPGVRLLLCSDGLHGMVSQSALATMLRDSSIDQLPTLMVEAANAGGGRDNITVLCGALATDERTVVDGPVPFRRTRPVWAGPVAAGLAALFVSGAMAAIVVGAVGGGDDDGGPTVEASAASPSPSATISPPATRSVAPGGTGLGEQDPPTVTPTNAPVPTATTPPATATPTQTTRKPPAATPTPIPPDKPSITCEPPKGHGDDKAICTSQLTRTAGFDWTWEPPSVSDDRTEVTPDNKATNVSLKVCRVEAKTSCSQGEATLPARPDTPRLAQLDCAATAKVGQPISCVLDAGTKQPQWFIENERHPEEGPKISVPSPEAPGNRILEVRVCAGAACSTFLAKVLKWE